MPDLWNDYLDWCREMSWTYKTFSFWDKFIKFDVFAYIQLFLAIRTGNWNWRQAAIKCIGSLFHAFDHQNYSCWLPIHLSQMFAFPDNVLLHFQNGSFVSSITGINYSSVAFDEAHKMHFTAFANYVKFN